MDSAIIPQAWRPFYDATHIPAAVRAGDTLYLSGHAGEGPDGAIPGDLEQQVRNTFAGMDRTLKEAGADWPDVVQLTSYHIGVREQAEVVLKVAAEFLHEPYPSWTAVGVAELFDEGALLDMSAIAVVSRP